MWTDELIGTMRQRVSALTVLQSSSVDRLQVAIINYESAWRPGIGDVARCKLILSGTPVTNSAIDLWSQYRFMDPAVFGRNYWAFRSRYVVMGGYENKKIIGYRNVDELIKREYSRAYRATKLECLDLPEQVFERRVVILEPGL